MTAPRSLVAACAVTGALAACAGFGAASFAPGSNLATVTQRMGAPSGDYALPSGGHRVEYSGGAYGRQTTMFDFDAAGALQRAEQVRDESHFNAIRAGMLPDEVLSRIGHPSTTWAIPRQNQVVWSYRYESPFCQWFMVGIAEGRVADTSYGPDPLCEEDDFFHRFMRR